MEQHQSAGNRRVITALAIGWLVSFGYLLVVERLPEIPFLADGIDVSPTYHFVASLILGVLLFQLARSWRPAWRPALAAWAAVGAAAGFGLALELVQGLVPARAPEYRDIFGDVLGAAAGAILMLVIAGVIGWRRTAIGAQSLGVVAITAAITSIAVWAPPGLPTCAALAADPPVRAVAPDAGDGLRVSDGLLALYGFDEGSGRVVREQAGVLPGLDLQLSRPDMWLPSQAGIGFGDDLASTAEPATALSDAMTSGDAFTAEVWLRPARLDQNGPVRIVSLSDGIHLDEVSFHLGQEDTCLSVRVDSGRPTVRWYMVEGVFLEPRPVWHLVLAYEQGEARTYAQGALVDRRKVGGQRLPEWDADYPLVVGNETTNNRAYAGAIFKVAVYGRALAADEVAQNYRAGQY